MPAHSVMRIAYAGVRVTGEAGLLARLDAAEAALGAARDEIARLREAQACGADREADLVEQVRALRLRVWWLAQAPRRRRAALGATRALAGGAMTADDVTYIGCLWLAYALIARVGGIWLADLIYVPSCVLPGWFLLWRRARAEGG